MLPARARPSSSRLVLLVVVGAKSFLSTTTTLAWPTTNQKNGSGVLLGVGTNEIPALGPCTGGVSVAEADVVGLGRHFRAGRYLLQKLGGDGAELAGGIQHGGHHVGEGPEEDHRERRIEHLGRLAGWLAGWCRIFRTTLQVGES